MWLRGEIRLPTRFCGGVTDAVVQGGVRWVAGRMTSPDGRSYPLPPKPPQPMATMSKRLGADRDSPPRN